MTSTPRVLVVGGGLAGLVAARHLAGGGLEATLLERRETVGGRVRTLERDEYRFDRGFQVLFPAYPAVQRELDLEALELRRFTSGATIAHPGGRSVLADPRSAPGTLPATLRNPDITLGDRLRVARLWWELRRTDLETLFDGGGTDEPDESIETFLRERGFSDGFIETFVAPFYGGITLDRSLSTSRRVFEYTFRTLAAGGAAVPAAGMEAIPRQLADHVREVGGGIKTGREVEAVSSEGDSATVQLADGMNGEVDAVVVATDPPTARDLTGLESIPTDARGCVTQYYALPDGTSLETGKRLLLNAVDGDGPNHVVPHSAVAPEHAPDGSTLISATYLGCEVPRTSSGRGDSRDPEASDEPLAERTRDALESWYPEQEFDGLEPLYTERVPFAQFDQPPGIHDRLPETRDPSGSVYLAGDYTRWSSIQGAMRSGREAAKAVLEDHSR
ncbi:amine oxidase [Haloterrigena turkmenica DSM 5511]|uniref:Amine oxidase n=1 Tax=Haloterrigena turkmenica (strain ATCC 51198 / DSM 5511 / JCM 9101 / NCIMB 13204 / VKM B-1734 / 4k) TaxID=543526 RepID=D2RPG8_HALTV|nr:NAD(P)/FAD-dependent oxidoreductase [Haloterrigena turkmenica]ADB60202.1 amine oxidase [Haloterrigena turkmenica DSM 5511]